jgi:methionine-rich copper-binding protein CopC
MNPFVKTLRAVALFSVIAALSWASETRAAGPTITSTTPPSGATGVSPNTPVVFTFSAAMNTNLTMVTFQDTNGNTLNTSIAWSADSKTLACIPTPPWPSPDFILWDVNGQDTGGLSLQGIPVGTFTVGGSSGGGCTTLLHTNTAFFLEEYWSYDQTSAAAPTLDATNAYTVLAEATLVSNLNGTAAFVSLPNQAVTNLPDVSGTGQLFLTSDSETSLTTLNNNWPAGTYTFNVSGTSPALPQVPVSWNLTQPNAPQIANYTAAQSVDPTKPFTLSWNSFSATSGNTNFISINIGYNFCAGTGFSTNLPASATSVIIPAGALQASSNYTGSTIGFISANFTSNSSPNYVATAARSSITTFTLSTLGSTSGGSLSLTNPALSGATFAFTVNTQPNKTVTVEYSSTLQPGSWTTLVVTNSGSGTITVTDPNSTGARARFYRARE